MVHANLHVICGNCGSTDMEYRRDDVTEDGGDGSNLICHNCATLHSLRNINFKNGYPKEQANEQ